MYLSAWCWEFLSFHTRDRDMRSTKVSGLQSTNSNLSRWMSINFLPNSPCKIARKWNEKRAKAKKKENFSFIPSFCWKNNENEKRKKKKNLEENGIRTSYGMKINKEKKKVYERFLATNERAEKKEILWKNFKWTKKKLLF